MTHQNKPAKWIRGTMPTGCRLLKSNAAFWQKFNWNVQIPAHIAVPASCTLHKQNVYIINISTDLFSVSKYNQTRQIAPHKHEGRTHIHQNIRERPSCMGRIRYKQFFLWESQLLQGFLFIFPSWQFNLVHEPTIHKKKTHLHAYRAILWS